jgi:hypothetical protein
MKPFLPKKVNDDFDRILTPILKASHEASNSECKPALGMTILLFKSFMKDAMDFEKKRLIRGLKKL